MKFKAKKSALASSLKKQPPPFSGEVVMCEICKVTAKSDPHVSLAWRCIEIDGGKRFFTCADCRPKDDASSDEWKDFWVNFTKEYIIPKRSGRPIRSFLYWKETGDGPPIAERVM